MLSLQLPPRNRPRRAALGDLGRLLAAIALVASSLPVHAAPPYELGLGYRLPWLGLTAGGYVTLRAGNLEGEPVKAILQDLSLFLTADLSARWHFFTELELGDSLVWTRDGLSTSDAEFDVERLYLDHHLAPRSTLRFGKFLTPIGRWNLIHADPLVWSVFRPLTTSAAFARHATGIALLGSWPFRDASLEYQVYIDDSNALDPGPGYEPTFLDSPVVPNPDNVFSHGGGLRLRYQAWSGGLQIGFSAARFTLTHQPATKNLVGADVFYARDGLELTGEAVYRKSPGVNGSEWGGFAQLVLPVAHQLFAVLSAERFKAEGYSEATDIARLGLAYRPTPPVSLKIELQESHGVEVLAPDGWQLSVAVLF